MRLEERRRARELRALGWSYNDILQEVGVSKSTLSLWLRDVPLSEEQISALQCKQTMGREKFIRNVRARRDSRWADHHRQAEEEYVSLSRDPEFMFGLALYIGEGSKSSTSAVCLTNCDPHVIQKGQEFFLRIGVPASSLRGAIHLHPGLNVEAAEAYWHEVTGLPPVQFHQTSFSVSRASNGKKGNAQSYGTFHLGATHTRVRQKLSRWMALALTARSFIG